MLQPVARAVAQVKDVFQKDKGIYALRVAGGKLILVVGPYQDALSFRRGYISAFCGACASPIRMNGF
jgi:hypothetical protein